MQKERCRSGGVGPVGLKEYQMIEREIAMLMCRQSSLLDMPRTGKDQHPSSEKIL